MRKIKLVIRKLTHASLNDWTKWFWKEKWEYGQDWNGEIMVALIEACGVTKLRPVIKKASITIKYYFKVKPAKRDYDNYAPKFIMDGLVGRVLLDDRDDWVKVKWDILYDKERPRTLIEVEEIT